MTDHSDPLGISQIQIRDRAALIHPYSHLDPSPERNAIVMCRGEGVFICDDRGRSYLEGMSGLWCHALGFGHREMAETAKEQISTLSFAHLFGDKTHEGAIELAEKIKEISPVPASKVIFTSSGSEANDTQIKLVRYYNNARGLPKKKKIISRMRAYHGTTMASASLTGLADNHTDFDLPIEGIFHAQCPDLYRGREEGESEQDFSTRLALQLEQLIESQNPDEIAAFIAEPIMGAGGVVVPPAGYFQKIQEVLDRYDILFIADEVICGFGRTGARFGSDLFGMTPDSISIAKALTSGYAPLGAVTVPEKIYAAMCDQSRKIGLFGHGFTYSGHPLSTALALKALEIYQRDNIFDHVKEVSKIFIARLKALGDHPLVGDARGVGLIGGIELVADKSSRKAFKRSHKIGAQAVDFCAERGLILRALGDIVALCPPLIISESEINLLFDRLEKALNDLDGLVKKEQLYHSQDR